MAGLNLSAGVKSHSLKDRLNDVYETPPEATEGLLRAENLPGVIWEPCCGPGAIVRLLRASGRMVYATDLVDYQSPDQDESGWDFLMERQLPIGTEAIVMNPPFKNAGEFVEKAIDLCPKVYMLGRLAFLESDRRSVILDGGMLARVHVERDGMARKLVVRWPSHGLSGTGIMPGPRQLIEFNFKNCPLVFADVHATKSRGLPLEKDLA